MSRHTIVIPQIPDQSYWDFMGIHAGANGEKMWRFLVQSEAKHLTPQKLVQGTFLRVEGRAATYQVKKALRATGAAQHPSQQPYIVDCIKVA